MELKDLISICEIKEKQIKACFSYYRKRLGEDEMKSVRSVTSMYAKTMAEGFLKAHEQFFENEQNKVEFLRYASSVGANKPHSGYRFLEELYSLVATKENEKQDIENN